MLQQPHAQDLHIWNVDNLMRPNIEKQESLQKTGQKLTDLTPVISQLDF